MSNKQKPLTYFIRRMLRYFSYIRNPYLNRGAGGVHALKYYSTLKMDNYNPSTHPTELFMTFFDNAYIKLLDDYQHIISTHETFGGNK